jgi:uncharacterized protein YcaQ
VNPEHARRIALDAQGLLRRNGFGRGLVGARRALETIGYVQIDTISVVARAHHHVLWSRVPGFRTDYLEQLVARREAFEYWAHAAAYLPMGHYRFALPRMHAIKGGETHWIRNRDHKLMAAVVDRIRTEGPLKARDFETPDGEGAGWWNWKPAKRALEQLYMQGDLMVSRREGFEKVYDLPERVLPANIDTREPEPPEMAAYLVQSTLRAHGHATQKSFTYQRKGSQLRTAVAQYLEERTAARELVRRTLADGQVIYAAPDVLEQRPRKPSGHVRLLSPFDNAIIQRDRTRALFGYDYQLECYVPAAKRRYGYYCLPVLFGDALVGRIDAKADRGARVFRVHCLHIEAPISDRDRFLGALRDEIHAYAAFNECPRIVVDRTTPASWRKSLQRYLE